LDSVFEKLEAAQDGQDRSPAWWKKAGKIAVRSTISEATKEEIIQREKSNTDDPNGVRMKPRTGTLVLFEYDAKTTKQSMKYYDRLPLLLVLDVKQQHFIGANLHYISPKKRLKTIEALLNGKIDVPRKVIHKYKRSDVEGSLFIEIAESDWDSAMYMPIEQFVSAIGKIEIPVPSLKVWVEYDPQTKYRFRAKRKIQ
tara:strand:- start:13537 stop:14130 length:594 start_codon:yes stop_codon:yes gene_type:complete